MTEQEVRTLLTDALVNLFIDHIKRETGRKLQAEDFRNVRTVDDVVQAVLKVQAADGETER